MRYNGRTKDVRHPWLEQWRQEGRLVPACPELLGGFPVPRLPAEIVGGDGDAVLTGRAAVIDSHGADVTAAFIAGAQALLVFVRDQDIRHALLTEPSPSCGARLIHDGSFGGILRPGRGVAAAVLRRAGVAVFAPDQIDDLAGRLGLSFR